MSADTYDFQAYRQRVAERIKFLRRQKGYASYEEFAHRHNISRSQVYRYENAKGDFRFESLLKVIYALGVTPAEFFSVGFDSW